MPGSLFAHYFLTDGIKATPEWHASVASAQAFAAFVDGVRQRYNSLSQTTAPNEAVTEQELIHPVLELLGWADYLPQQGAAGNEDIPDLLLFADAGSKERAAARSNANERYRDAVVVEESKRFRLPLDTRDASSSNRSRTPHGQILRYLSTAEVESENRIRWGILTNGGVWRLYDYRARPRATAYFEADLGKMLASGDEDGLRLSTCCSVAIPLLRNRGHDQLLGSGAGRGPTLRGEGRKGPFEVVFERVFPKACGSARERPSGEELSDVRHGALIFLYRLLFVLYAGGPGPAPVNDSRYEDYGLRKPVREDIARRMADGAVLSTRATSYYDHLMTLCQLIDEGDPSIGMPPYNGGLFAAEAAPLLAEVRLPDSTIAPIIYALSHTETEGTRNSSTIATCRSSSSARSTSVCWSGSLSRDDDGKIVVRPNPYARKDSGSFFTPQELVDLIVDRTLKPLAEERLKAFEDKSKGLKSDHRPTAERRTELRKVDPAEAVLDLKVLDPAMGSGHFLVTAVDFLSDYIADLVEYVPRSPEWLAGEYVSPLVERVETIRRDIPPAGPGVEVGHGRGPTHGPSPHPPDGAQRCIYGVDKNP